MFSMNEWMNLSHCSVKCSKDRAASSPTQQQTRMASRSWTGKPEEGWARNHRFKVQSPLCFLGEITWFTQGQKGAKVQAAIQIQLFLEASFFDTVSCGFILSEESLGVCLDVPKLKCAQLTTCPAIPLFFLPSGLSGTSFSQEPQSQPAIYKAGVVPIYCTLGKHRVISCGGESVACITSISFPQHQPIISTVRLCHKPTG